LSDHFSSSLRLELSTTEKIIKITKGFHSNKAAGYDNIPMSIIQNSIETLSRPLSHLINLSFITGTVPHQLKISRVIPLFKSGDKRCFSNYRPVSILTSFSKIFGKKIYNRLSDYLLKFRILYDNQFGFRKGYLTLFALIDLVDKISSAIDNNEVAVGFFMDLSKAFDNVNYEILFTKLEHNGIRGSSLQWIKSYLSNRCQIVQYNNFFLPFNLFYVGSRKAQYLVLCYFWFILTISVAKVILFADDTNLFFSHRDPIGLNNILNEITKFFQWLTVNKLSLNTDKTKFIIFRPRQKKILFIFTLCWTTKK